MRFVKYPNEYKDWINRDFRTFDFRMTLKFSGSNSLTTLTTNEVSSIRITSDLLPSDTFTIGTSASDTLEFSLLIDSDTQIDTSVPVKPYITLYTEVMINGVLTPVMQEVALGVFYINPDGITKKGLHSITVRASSMISHPDYGGRIYTAPPQDQFFKNTIADIANDICNKLGITLKASSPALPVTAIISNRDHINGMTYRELINHIAMLYGGYARITNDGLLEFFRMKDTEYVYDTSNYISLTKEEKTLTVKRFVCAISDEEVITSGSGSIADTVDISNSDMTKFLLDDILSAYYNFSYSPISSKIFGNPILEVGDIIKVIDVKGHEHIVPLQSIAYNLSGNGLTMEIKSIYTVNSISKGTSIRKVVNEITEEIVKTKVIIADELEVVYGSINDLKATKADIQDLKAVQAQIETLDATKAHIEELTTGKADIKELNDAIDEIDGLKDSKANASDLTATNKTVSDLSSKHNKFESSVATTYATKEELKSKSDDDHKHEEYLTEHQDISHLATTESVNQALGNKSDEGHTHEQYITEHQDISHLASIESMNEALGNKSDEDHTHEEYLTEHQDISHLATTESVDSTIRSLQEIIAGLEARIVALEGGNSDGEDSGEGGDPDDGGEI